MELISVVIPVYKAEQFLDEAVASVANQTYRNLEIILVNDGSPDSSGRICDEWAAKDDRVRVIHKANGGASEARNDGIAAATGEYLGFIDSDDRVEPDYFNRLYDAIKSTGCRIAEGRLVTYLGGELPEVPPDGFTEPTKVKYGEHIETSEFFSCFNESFCTKLIKREVMQNRPFPAGMLYEDSRIICKLFLDEQYIAAVPSCNYYYRQSNVSIVRRKFDGTQLQTNQIFEERMELLAQIGMHNMVERTKCKLVFDNLVYYYWARKDKAGKTYIATTKQYIKRYAPVARQSKYFDKRSRLMLSLYRIFPTLYYIAALMYRKGR